jgi:hypothetical protein
MLSTDHVRKQLGDPTLSEEDVESVRDVCRALAESIIEACECRHARSKLSAPVVAVEETGLAG